MRSPLSLKQKPAGSVSAGEYSRAYPFAAVMSSFLNAKRQTICAISLYMKTSNQLHDDVPAASARRLPTTIA
jgi:hypothetical protein